LGRYFNLGNISIIAEWWGYNVGNDQSEPRTGILENNSVLLCRLWSGTVPVRKKQPPVGYLER